MRAPPATGQRITWAEVPEHVRAGIEHVLGGRVVNAASQSGGFSPGTADRLLLENGDRAFVKAVSPLQNPDSPDVLRREGDNLAVLGASAHVPRLIGRYDDDVWVALALEDIDGCCPAMPWRDEHVAAALDTLAGLAAELTPSPIPDLEPLADGFSSLFAGWRRLQTQPAELVDPWVADHLEQLARLSESTLAQLVGDTVVHCDVRADNLLVRADGSMVVVDWPWALVGPDWVDRLLLMINIDLYGGHDVEALVARWMSEVDPELITGALAGLCAFFTDAGRQPPVPGLPTLRAFQQAQAESTTAWLRRRLSGGSWT
jgi:hypothetical protein